MSDEPIYLDHAATTPLRPEAREAWLEGIAIWANPSSPHRAGRAARAALEDARERVKAALRWEGEAIFTSGASEALAIGLGRAKAARKIVSAVEHDAVFAAAPGAVILPAGADGAVDLEALDRELARGGDAVVAVQTINSETGNGQDFCEVHDIMTEADGLYLIDASQSAGKYRFRYQADMVVVSAHKLGGPVGIGALLLSDFDVLEPAGGQERGYRRGTENLPGAMAFAAALEACGEPYVEDRSHDLLEEFAGEVRALGGTWFADRLDAPTAYIHAVAMPGLSGRAQLMRFDLQGIAVSQGSACSSGTMKTSHVLRAMGVAEEEADRTIRFSLGWNTTREEVQRFCEAWIAMAREAGARAA
jgi:cysteine desulfurase